MAARGRLLIILVSVLLLVTLVGSKLLVFDATPAYADTASTTWDFATTVQSWTFFIPSGCSAGLFTTDGSPAADSIQLSVVGRSKSCIPSMLSPLQSRSSMGIPSTFSSIDTFSVSYRTKTNQYNTPGPNPNSYTVNIDGPTNGTDQSPPGATCNQVAITGITAWSADLVCSFTPNQQAKNDFTGASGIKIDIDGPTNTGASSSAIVQQLFDHIIFTVTYTMPTPTPTVTNTPTNTPVPTNTPTATPTNTPVPPTSTPTDTPVPTNTPTATPTNTPVPPTSTPTDTPVPTNTPTATPTDTPTATPTNTNTPTATPTNTEVPTATPTPFRHCYPHCHP